VLQGSGYGQLGRRPMSKVWIITGSGSGLGRATAEAGLEAGDRVVATARNTDQLTDLRTKAEPRGISTSFVPCIFTFSMVLSNRG